MRVEITMNEKQIQEVKETAKERAPDEIPDQFVELLVEGAADEIEEGVVPLGCSVEVKYSIVEEESAFEQSHIHDEPYERILHLTPEHSRIFDEFLSEMKGEMLLDAVEEEL